MTGTGMPQAMPIPVLGRIDIQFWRPANGDFARFRCSPTLSRLRSGSRKITIFGTPSPECRSDLTLIPPYAKHGKGDQRRWWRGKSAKGKGDCPTTTRFASVEQRRVTQFNPPHAPRREE